MSVSTATSAAFAAAAIFDSKEDKQEVSDVVNGTSNSVDNDYASDVVSCKDDNDDMSKVDVFLLDAWVIMNRASRNF
jgi:hypothetical protein